MNSSPAPRHAQRAQTIALIVASAMFMQNLDSAIINTSLPRMALSFRVTTVDLSLGITAYVLASAALSPLSGWLADRFGSRNVLCGAVLGFTAASVLCGLSRTLPQFVIARLLQGSGGALMMPVGISVMMRHTEKSDLMRITAIMVWPALLAPILGPELGGFITQTFDWRWNFWLNLPIGLAGAIAIFLYVPKEATEAGRKLDLFGFVLCSVALTCLIAGFQRSSVGGGELAFALLLLAVGLGAGIMTIRHFRTHPAPLLQLSPILRPSFFHSSVFPGLLFRAQFSATPFLLPLLFQLGFGLSPIAAGGWVMVYFMGNLGIKPATTWILKSYGFRNITVFNGLLVSLTTLGCGFITLNTPKIPLILLLLAAGAVRSMQMTSLTTLVFADIPSEEKTAASTLLAMLAQTASAAGVALGAFLLALFVQLFGETHVELPVLHASFWVLAVMGFVGAMAFLRMPADIGRDVSLHRSADIERNEVKSNS